MKKNLLPLLFLHTEAARMPMTDVGKHLKQSPQRLAYQLGSLEREGVIKQAYSIIDYSYFGLVLFKVYFHGAYVSENEKKTLLAELLEHPFIVAVYELSGEFDLAVEFACPNPSKFNKEWKELIRKNQGLNDCKVSLNVVTYICPKRYMAGRQELGSLFPEAIIGGDRITVNFTEQERLIVRAILMDPLARYTKLALLTGLNIKTVRSVLLDLQKREIIRGYKCLIDTYQAGVYMSRLFLRLHHINLERENLLLKRILSTPEVVKVSKTIGDWSMEVDLESFDRRRIKEIMVSLREEFKELIERSSLMEFYDYYWRAFLPRFIFKDLDEKKMESTKMESTKDVPSVRVQKRSAQR